MSPQHLSDEAVAAFADGVLRGHARERASRHASSCEECARAVREQREAVLALRAAPAPQLPTGLVERLRALPVRTPLPGPTPGPLGSGLPTDSTAPHTDSAAPFRAGPGLPRPLSMFGAAALIPMSGATSLPASAPGPATAADPDHASGPAQGSGNGAARRSTGSAWRKAGPLAFGVAALAAAGATAAVVASSGGGTGGPAPQHAAPAQVTTAADQR